MSILKLTDICKDYIQGKEPVRVLKNVCLEVEQGDYIAIMGPSGSGKSTLMNIIGCLDVPTSGEYVLDGKNLHDLKDDDLAEVRNKYIGFVFQSYYLMPKMDAVDNVALPLLYADVPLKERRERAAESLGVVGLEDRIHFLPNQMSGGQCQRVAIARAMVTEYGMSEKVGMINYGGDENEVFIGRDLAHARSYGESVATAIDSEVKRIIDECYEKAKKIILDHENVLHKCCELLLEKEKISQDEFEALFE